MYSKNRTFHARTIYNLDIIADEEFAIKKINIRNLEKLMTCGFSNDIIQSLLC